MREIWVLGATGRTGRAVAARLHAAGVPLVLAGRDQERLGRVAVALGGAPRLLVGPLDVTLAELGREAPAVVLNTVGPFATTGPAATSACPPGTHYVDVANELEAVQATLALDAAAAATGRVFVTGAGFGVFATESVLLRLCAGRAPAARRLAAGEGRPGAYTPGALFGPDLALAAGGEFLDDPR